MRFKMNELKEIRGLLNDGLSISDIAELMGRSKKSIENLMARQKWTRGRFKEEEPVDPNSWDSILNQPEPSIEFPEIKHEEEIPVEVKETVAAMQETIKPVKEKTLNDFPARELIKNLYDRGYRIRGNEWKLVCLVEQVVNHIDIIKNG